MRAIVALTLLTTGFHTCVSSAATADDPIVTPPLPSATETAPAPSIDLTDPGDHEFVPSMPQTTPSYESSPPATSYGNSMPRRSYEEVSFGYPAPSYSLVPSALSSGPMFFGAGNYGGASAGGTHIRYPYYNYRSPWTYGGPASVNHTIVW